MTGPNPILKTREDAAIVARFNDAAKRRGVTPSELLRTAVRRELGLVEGVPPDVEATPEDSDTTRMTVRLPAFVKKAVAVKAHSQGMAPGRWVAALVQSNIARQPVLNDRELGVLEASNRELFAIGRNINQMARVLNEAHFKTEQVKIEKLDEVMAYIKKTRDAIRGVIKASRNAWREE